MQEIYNNGPVAVNFLAVSDTYNYQSGIYIPLTGSKLIEIELE